MKTRRMDNQSWGGKKETENNYVSKRGEKNTSPQERIRIQGSMGPNLKQKPKTFIRRSNERRRGGMRKESERLAIRTLNKGILRFKSPHLKKKRHDPRFQEGQGTTYINGSANLTIPNHKGEGRRIGDSSIKSEKKRNKCAIRSILWVKMAKAREV